MNREYAIATIESKDDAAIIAEITSGGVALAKDYVYSFKQSGKTVSGLTIAGINEASNRRGGIEVTELTHEDRGASWLATAKAVDTVTGSERWGAYQQSKKLPNGKTDPYAFTKAVHKAQRNAIKQLLPVSIIKQVLNFYLHGIKPDARIPIEPPPKDDAQMKRCFAIAKNLESNLADNNISQRNLWNWVRIRYQVDSRTEMTASQWSELAAELDAAERTPVKLNELINNLCDLIETEIIEESAADAA